MLLLKTASPVLLICSTADPGPLTLTSIRGMEVLSNESSNYCNKRQKSGGNFTS